MDFSKRNEQKKKSKVGVEVAFVLLLLFLVFVLNQVFTGASSIGSVAYSRKIQDREIEEKIYLSDMISTGEDKAQIDLLQGESFALGSNTRVSFVRLNNRVYVNLHAGNFVMKGAGTAQIAMDGQLLSVDGTHYEVQFYRGDDNKLYGRLVSGDATVFGKNLNSMNLDIRKVTAIERFQNRLPKAPALARPPVADQLAEVVPYTWKLYDLYLQAPERLVLRPKPVDYVSVEVALSWHGIDDRNGPQYVQTAKRPNLQDAVTYMSETSYIILTKAFIGPNFWRVSNDQKNWSELQLFNVSPLLHPATPTLTPYYTQIPLNGGGVAVPIGVQTTMENPQGFLVEVSNKDTFDPESTTLNWTYKKDPFIWLNRVGTYYYRMRAVGPALELTNWSQAKSIDVTTPRLAQKTKMLPAVEGYAQEPVRLVWDPVKNATSYRVSLYTDSGKRVDRFISREPSSDWTSQKPGLFRMAVMAKLKNGQRVQASVPWAVLVKERPPVMAEPIRQPAVAQLTTTLEAPKPAVPNDKYGDSFIGAEAGAWVLQSTDQAIQGQDLPVATGLGIRMMKWWDRSGFEGLFKNGVFSSQTSDLKISSQKAEGRYHYRFKTDLPYNLAREMQVSWFLGLEAYRSSGGGYFAKRYDLLKFGTDLEFKLARHWVTGGELVHGYGFDKSNKQEIAGHLRYYLNPDWSLGLGYRIHFFEAGSLSSSAGILPYREGYTEGYSSLLFHY